MGEEWKLTDFIFLGSKITADGDSSHEIKTFAPWKESYDKPRWQRHHFANQCWIVKTMVFPVVIYGCESWTIKKVESWIINAFELWCWRRFLRVPWIASRSNQSNLKEINPKCSLEGLILKLKLQYFGHLMQSQLIGKDPDISDSRYQWWVGWERWCWERLRAGEEGDRGYDGWMASLTQCT